MPLYELHSAWNRPTRVTRVRRWAWPPSPTSSSVSRLDTPRTGPLARFRRQQRHLRVDTIWIQPASSTATRPTRTTSTATASSFRTVTLAPSNTSSSTSSATRSPSMTSSRWVILAEARRGEKDGEVDRVLSCHANSSVSSTRSRRVTRRSASPRVSRSPPVLSVRVSPTPSVSRSRRLTSAPPSTRRTSRCLTTTPTCSPATVA